MTADVAPERAPTKFELLLDFVKTRLLTIVALVLLAAGVAMIAGFEIAIPRRLKLALLVFALLAPAGLMTGNYVIGLLYDPNNVWVIDLDARVVDGALFRFPYDDFQDLTVVDSEGRDSRAVEMTALTPNLHVGKNVDLDAMTVQGTWRGTLDDRELLRALTKVEECRGQLEEDARRGFALETQAFTVIRSCVRQATMQIVRTFERGTLPDEGESIGEQVDKAIEDFDVDDRLDDVDLEDLDPEVDPGDAEGEPDSSADVDATPTAGDPLSGSQEAQADD